jgi:glycosyltransferase involved in cell wall biosynthesis
VIERACITVMPVYNEQHCVERVCREWLEQIREIGGWLLVVDDGSCDATPEILARLGAGEERLRVVRQANAGHGAAILHGYQQALALGCEWVFQVDSDGEIPAALFARLWEQRDRAAFLLGHRTGRLIHPPRLALSRVLRWMLSMMFGIRLRDPNIPYRLMRAAELRQLLAHVPPDAFAPNVFLALLAAKAGWLAEGPEVPVEPRHGVSSIRGWRMARVALRCAGELWRFRRRDWPRFQGGQR